MEAPSSVATALEISEEINVQDRRASTAGDSLSANSPSLPDLLGAATNVAADLPIRSNLFRLGSQRGRGKPLANFFLQPLPHHL